MCVLLGRYRMVSGGTHEYGECLLCARVGVHAVSDDFMSCHVMPCDLVM